MTATIFRLPGTFNNPALPIVAPLIRSGLVAAWRLYAGGSSMHDLSGNGHSLKIVGTPSWTANGVICNQYNHFVTDVYDMSAMTICVVMRPILDADGSGSSTPGAGTWRQENGVNRGLGIWNNGTSTVQNLNVRTTGPDASGSDRLITNTFGGNRPLPVDGAAMDYAFAAASFNPIANTTQARAPRYSNGNVIDIDWDSTSPNLILADRRLTLDDGDPAPVVIGAAPGVSGVDGEVEICEVLIYQGALSTEQVLSQYEYSKKFYQEVFSIDV